MSDSLESVKLDFARKLAKVQDDLTRFATAVSSNDLAQITTASRDLTPTVQSAKLKTIQELKNLWINYLEPSYTLEEYASYVTCYNKTCHQREIDRERERHRINFLLDMNRPPPVLVDMPARAQQQPNQILFEDSRFTNSIPPLQYDFPLFKQERYVITKGKITLALDPATGVQLSRPLEYVHEIQSNLLTDQVIFFPQTKIVNIETSFRRILTHSESLGLSRSQFGKLLLLFVKNFLPEYFYIMQDLNEPNEIVSSLLNLLNTNNIATTVQKLLDSLTREPTESIYSIFNRYCALIRLKVRETEPFLHIDKVNAKCERLALEAMKKFVSDPARRAYVNTIQDRKYFGDSLDKSTLLQFLSEFEDKEISAQYLQSRSVEYQEVQLNRTTATASNAATTTRSRSRNDPLYKHDMIPTKYRVRSKSNTKKNPSFSSSRSPSKAGSVDKSRGRSSSARRADKSRSSSLNKPDHSGQGRPNSITRPSRSPGRRPSRTPSREQSRHSSQSRERRREDINNQIDTLRKELSKLSDKSCARCKSTNHKSQDCFYSFSKNFCKNCKCYHDQAECRKLFQGFPKN